MDYIVVLQWRDGECMTLERLVSCENAIMDLLENKAEIDGHDWNASEMKIFILTENPTATFDQITRKLQEIGVYDDMRAAFRHIDAEDYTTLAPSGLTVFAVS